LCAQSTPGLVRLAAIPEASTRSGDATVPVTLTVVYGSHAVAPGARVTPGVAVVVVSGDVVEAVGSGSVDRGGVVVDSCAGADVDGAATLAGSSRLATSASEITTATAAIKMRMISDRRSMR